MWSIIRFLVKYAIIPLPQKSDCINQKKLFENQPEPVHHPAFSSIDNIKTPTKSEPIADFLNHPNAISADSYGG
jgi:hypothetical protein